MNLKKNALILFLLCAVALLGAGAAHASNPGAIGTPSQALVCHDTTCASPTPGTINWKPTGTTAVVIDSVTGLSGYVWGNELGWINLNPTGEGVTFANATTGLLTGKAWSQVSGWINFAPTGQTVTISPSTGQFSGWAWTGGPFGGWIKFDCSDNDSCVDTTWSPSSGGPRSGSVPSATNDVCSNITGIQSTLPQGYSVSAEGSCIQVTDACPNIAGDQALVPGGFVRNEIGACVPSGVDYCANIAGNQNVIPSGYVVSNAGNCVTAALDACPDQPGTQSSAGECGGDDLCPNIPGVQGEIPTGYASTGTACYPGSLDVCANVEGSQPSIPQGMILETNGDCVAEPADLCANLAGYQSVIPKGFYQSGTACFFGAAPLPDEFPDGEVVTYGFVPSWLRLPSDESWLTNIVRLLGLNKTEQFKVDTTSAIVSAAGLLFLLFLLMRIVRWFL